MVSSVTHIQPHERNRYCRTAKKKQIAPTSWKGLEPRRRSEVGSGRDLNAGDSRCIGSLELDWIGLDWIGLDWIGLDGVWEGKKKYLNTFWILTGFEGQECLRIDWSI